MHDQKEKEENQGFLLKMTVALNKRSNEIHTSTDFLFTCLLAFSELLTSLSYLHWCLQESVRFSLQIYIKPFKIILFCAAFSHVPPQHPSGGQFAWTN